MRIDLGGRDVAMAEHLVHRAQVSAALEQMGREAMAQRVRADPTQTRVARGPSLERLEESLARHRTAEPAREKGRIGFYGHCATGTASCLLPVRFDLGFFVPRRQIGPQLAQGRSAARPDSPL